MKKRKILIVVGAVLLIFVALGVSLYRSFRSTGLPLREGTVSMNCLEAPVDIRWDRYGVPHIEASNTRDLARAMGWVHANDRLAQMEFGRRAAQGRLAELTGASALFVDVHYRSMRIYSHAGLLLGKCSGESREWLTCYAEGVNAWIESREDDLPPEFTLLGGEIAPWTAQDSVALNLMLAHDHSFSVRYPEEDRWVWLNTLDLDRLQDLFPTTSPETFAQLKADLSLQQPTPLPDSQQPGSSISAPDSQQPGSVNSEKSESAGGTKPDKSAPGGSNHWAIAGELAPDGPLVGGDPHLPLSLPSIWYQALLRCPDYEASGMTIPGWPVVVVGQSREIGWSFSLSHIDDQDLYFEDFDRDTQSVRRGGSWVPVTTQSHTVRVKGQDDFKFDTRTTDLGLLIEEDPKRGLPFRSLRWAGHQVWDPLTPYLALARSKSLDEMKTGIAQHVSPVWVVMAAHRKGDSMMTIMGQLPNRAQGDGSWPSPGWQDGVGWSGMLEGTRYQSDVASTALVAANHDIRDDFGVLDAPVRFRGEFDSSHRVDRLRELIRSGSQWDSEQTDCLFFDTYSNFAQEVVSLLESEVDESLLHVDAQKALAALSTWDRRMLPRGPSALFALFQFNLEEELFRDEQTHLNAVPLSSRLKRQITLRSLGSGSAWVDNLNTSATENISDVVGSSLKYAWQRGTNLWGPNLSNWDYGSLTSVTLHHPLGGFPIIGDWLNRGPFQTSGSDTTLNAFGGFWTQGTLYVRWGPSMRMVCNVANPDQSRCGLPSGQAGHFDDSHYDDQLQDYLEQKLHPMSFSESSIAKATILRTQLLPVD